MCFGGGQCLKGFIFGVLRGCSGLMRVSLNMLRFNLEKEIGVHGMIGKNKDMSCQI